MTSKPIQVEEEFQEPWRLEDFQEIWPEGQPSPAYQLFCDCCRLKLGSGGQRGETIYRVEFTCPACKAGMHRKGWIGNRRPGARCPKGMGGQE